MIDSRATANISIMSHSNFLCLWQENLRPTFLAIFKDIYRIINYNHYAVCWILSYIQIYIQRNWKQGLKRYLMPMFIEVLFTAAKIRNNLNINQWMNI